MDTSFTVLSLIKLECLIFLLTNEQVADLMKEYGVSKRVIDNVQKKLTPTKFENNIEIIINAINENNTLMIKEIELGTLKCVVSPSTKAFSIWAVLRFLRGLPLIAKIYIAGIPLLRQSQHSVKV